MPSAALVRVVEFGRLTPAHRADLEGEESDPFDVAGVTLRFRPKERHVGLQDERGRLVASAGMLVVEAEADGRRFTVVGMGGVIVTASHRGRGLARRVVEAALDRARILGPEFAVLFCLPDRAGLYHRLGFSEVTHQVLVEQPGGHASMPLHTMWRVLRPGAIWPDGPVVLQSLPF